jgi:hypothetical protein
MIAKALQDFNGEPTDIKVRINLEVLWWLVFQAVDAAALLAIKML